MSLNILYKLFKLVLVTFSIIAVVPVSTNHRRHQQDLDVFESWGSTEIKIVKFRYTWTIQNFRFCCRKDNGNNELTSPTFLDGTNNGCAWKLHLMYPTERSYYSKQNDLLLYLSWGDCQVKAEYKFGILDAQGKEINIINNTIESNGPPSTIPEKLVKRDFLLEDENALLLDNRLTIFCEINATIGISESFSNTRISHLSKSHLGKDLGFLLENEAFSDVTLFTDGMEFKALKAILAARSPVFMAMFELDNSKSITIVEMNGTDHQVVKEMLRYMYTDELLNLQYLASDLLAAAEKYKLYGLKNICENFMSTNLSVENAAKYYVASDTHSAFELKSQAKKFIASHVSDVAHTSAFKSLIKTHPHLVEEIFYAFSQKLN